MHDLSQKIHYRIDTHSIKTQPFRNVFQNYRSFFGIQSENIEIMFILNPSNKQKEELKISAAHPPKTLTGKQS
jgi:hypothetical protein